MPALSLRSSTALCTMLAVLITACTKEFVPPAGSEDFDPPPEYRTWWSMTEACAGRSGALDQIEWYVLPGVNVLPGAEHYAGEWFEQGNHIVLAGNEQFVGALVRHEMLHALIRSGEHPRADFLERCGGVVSCEPECVRDAGPPPTPPAGTRHVSPTALEIHVAVQPPSPGAARDGGYFTLVVTAHNTASHAVVADLPPSDDAGPSGSFSWSVSSRALQSYFGDRAYDSEVTFFQPGETKRDVFDLHFGTDVDGGFAAGSYTATGSYGEHSSDAITFTLSP